MAAPTVLDLAGRISVRDDLTPALHDAERRMGSFAGTMQSDLAKAGDAAAAFGREIRPVLLGLTTGLSVGLGYAIKKAIDFDSLKRGLVAIAGSAMEAEAQLVRLKEVAKLPGLGFEEAIQGSTRLQAAGLSAQLAEKALLEFGNAIATVGGGKADLDGVTRALTQIVAKGKVTAEEINQIAERVPRVRVAMQEAFGTANTELIQKMGITAEQFITKMTTALEKNERVAGGLRNSIENLGDTFNEAARAVGDALVPALEATISAAETATQWFNSLNPVIQSTIAITAALGLASIVTGAAIYKMVTIVQSARAALIAYSIAAGGAATATGGVKLALTTLLTGAMGPVLLALAAFVPIATMAGREMVIMAGNADEAAGKTQILGAKVNAMVHDVLVKASGSVVKLSREWESLSAIWGKTKVPTAVVQGFRAELEKLGMTINEVGEIVSMGFKKMGDFAAEAMAKFHNSVLSISMMARTGASTGVDALRDQLSALNQAIENVAQETIKQMPALPADAEDFTKWQRSKLDAEAKMLEMSKQRDALQRKIDASEANEKNAKAYDQLVKAAGDYAASLRREIDLVGQSTEASKAMWEVENGRYRNVGDNLRKEIVDLAHKLDLKRQLAAIDEATTQDVDRRKTTEEMLRLGVLKPLEAAQQVANSIKSTIESVISQGIAGGDSGRAFAIAAKLADDYAAALVGVKHAEDELAKVQREREQIVAGARVLTEKILAMMTFNNQLVFSSRLIKDNFSADMNLANAMTAVKFAFQAAGDAVKYYVDRFQRQRDNYQRYMTELNIQIMRLTGGEEAAAKAALMMNEALTSGQADSVLALQRVVSELEKMKKLTDDIATGITDAFMEGLSTIATEGFGGFLRAFEKMLLDMAMAALRAQVFQWLQQLIGGIVGGIGGGIGGGAGGGGGNLGGLSGGFGGYGGGIGGLQMAPPSSYGGGGSSMNFVFSPTIHAKDARDVSESMPQLMSDAFREMHRQTRRTKGRL